MPAAGPDLLQGTLDLLILKALTLGELHGWAISKRIRQMSQDILTVNQGSLYPALYRLEERGWIASEPGRSPDGRAVKLYHLSPVGRQQLAREVKSWRVFSGAMDHVIQAG